MEILTSGKSFIKKSYDSLQNKIKKMEEENFLIPKKKEEAKGDEQAEADAEKANAEGDLNTILQNEVR